MLLEALFCHWVMGIFGALFTKTTTILTIVEYQSKYSVLVFHLSIGCNCVTLSCLYNTSVKVEERLGIKSRNP